MATQSTNDPIANSVEFTKSLHNILNLLDSFALASEPLAGTLKVFVNNVETTNYTYDSLSHSIKFPANALPPVGAEIKVVYSK
jgi:hypothetical protein